MGHNNGLITAPVSIDDVATVLGENSADTGTLCMSDKINTASIICPRYTMSPGLKVEEFETLKPVSVIGGQTGMGVSYAPSQKWGIMIPFVYGSSLNNIWRYFNTTWHINRPTATTVKGLHHFAGYKNNANVEHPIVDYTIAAGGNIAITLRSPGRESDILQNGGSLSIANVFDTGYFGCTVFKQPESVGSAFLDGATGASFISSTPIKTNGSETVAHIQTNVAAVPGYYYGIIPWVSDQSAINVNAKMFTLCISTGIKCVIEELVSASNLPTALTRVLYAEGYNPWTSLNNTADSFATYVGFKIETLSGAKLNSFRLKIDYTSGESDELTNGTLLGTVINPDTDNPTYHPNTGGGNFAQISSGYPTEVVVSFPTPQNILNNGKTIESVWGFCTLERDDAADIELAKLGHDWDTYHGGGFD